jgi:hypothetical protein
MASTYSSILNLEIQTTGENSGTWGTITNNNLQKLESAVKGYVSVAIASTTDSLSASDGSTTDEQSNAIIKLTGTLTGNTTMQCEAVESWYIVDNAATMGTYTLGFKPASGTAASLVSASKHLLYTDGSTMFDVLDDAGNITANGTLDVAGAVNFDGGAFIFNESSADVDLRIESNGNANAIFVDGGNDRVGIMNGSPSVPLDVTGAAKISGGVDLDGGAFTWNDSSANNLDFRCETATLDDAFFIDGSADKVGFGCQDPADAMVEINQSSTSAAIACLSLDQDDVDQEFIYFEGTSASASTASLSSSTAEAAAKTAAIRVNINGTDGWIRVYASAV